MNGGDDYSMKAYPMLFSNPAAYKFESWKDNKHVSSLVITLHEDHVRCTFTGHSTNSTNRATIPFTKLPTLIAALHHLHQEQSLSTMLLPDEEDVDQSILLSHSHYNTRVRVGKETGEYPRQSFYVLDVVNFAVCTVLQEIVVHGKWGNASAHQVDDLAKTLLAPRS